MQKPGCSHVHTLSHWLDGVGRWLAAAAVASLPLQAVAGRPLSVFGLLPFDSLVMLATAARLPALWSSRRTWLVQPAAWLALSLAGFGALSELFQPQPDLARRVAEQVAPLAAVLVLASFVQEGARGPVRRAALWGGGLAISVSLLGWVLDRCTGWNWVSEPGQHPVFDGLPRLFGSFAGSPERFGSYVVYWLALVFASPLLPWRRALLALGALALLFSMSYALVGGLLLAAAHAPRLRGFALGAALLAVVAASVPITRGPASEEVFGSCRALDVSHYLAIRSAPGQCRRLSSAGRAITPYREAKRVSWLAWIDHPWAGVGYSGFAAFSERAFEERYGAPGIHYAQPHGFFHGLPAKHGLLGLLIVLCWFYALRQGWRGSSWDWAVVAFLAIGLHIDVDRLRELWVLLAFLLADQLVGPKDGREQRSDALVSLRAVPYLPAPWRMHGR